MNRINIDGVVYEKTEVDHWENDLDPEGLYIIYLKNMYKLERVIDKPDKNEEEIGYKADM